MTVDDGAALHAVLSNPANYDDGYLMTPPTANVDESQAYVAGRLAVGPDHVPYVGRLASDGPLGEAGTVVGTSTIGDIEVHHEKAHIGWTMWDRRFWGTDVNPEAKLLMLSHLFDDCGFGRVKIQTDAVNHHSQAAIAKLGAQREGVLRRHARRHDGSFRDTVVFSILVDEWPAVKARLEARLRS
jgi:N-acetyltransferase